MRFTLTYDGALPSSGSKAPAKQRIREALHPQLLELWNHQPLVEHRDYLQPDDSMSVLDSVAGHTFAALIHTRLALLAGLDTLLLGPELPGGVITNRGDIDNRLKILFDALRMPSHPQEIAPGARPSSDEAPTHTLLSDDRLITRVSVDTDRLLAAPSADFARVIVRVTVSASKVMDGNLTLLT